MKKKQDCYFCFYYISDCYYFISTYNFYIFESEFSSYTGSVKESGQIKNVHITAINNCNKFYVCTYLVTFLTIKNLQKCVNNNGEAVFDLIEKVF